jgi:hypothetical protein
MPYQKTLPFLYLFFTNIRFCGGKVFHRGSSVALCPIEDRDMGARRCEPRGAAAPQAFMSRENPPWSQASENRDPEGAKREPPSLKFDAQG